MGAIGLLQCDLLNITSGLAGWALVAVKQLSAADPAAGMELLLQCGPHVQVCAQLYLSSFNAVLRQSNR